MRRLSLTRKNGGFDLRLIWIAETYGLKTVGQLQDFLARMQPQARVYYLCGQFDRYQYNRVAILKSVLENCLQGIK